MAGVVAELVRELKILRKGRALFIRQIAERVGSGLSQVCGVADGDTPAEVRRKVSDRIEGLAADLPEDLRLAVLVAFGIHRDARHPFYKDRVRWVARWLERDERTARRRIDEGIERLAELVAFVERGRGLDFKHPVPVRFLIGIPNFARAPRNAISSVGIWPVLRNATECGPCPA